ncbi:hypothetical protein VPH35_073514 [Triticum aestivum]
MDPYPPENRLGALVVCSGTLPSHAAEEAPRAADDAFSGLPETQQVWPTVGWRHAQHGRRLIQERPPAAEQPVTGARVDGLWHCPHQWRSLAYAAVLQGGGRGGPHRRLQCVPHPNWQSDLQPPHQLHPRHLPSEDLQVTPRPARL